MKVQQKVVPSVKYKNVYIADDGKEFESSDECRFYEADKIIIDAVEKFDLRSTWYDGELYYRFIYKKGNDELFKKMIELCITAEIDLDKKEVSFFRDLGNVQDFRYDKSAYDIFCKNKTWVEDNVYLITVYHRDECDTWDDFVVTIVDAVREARKVHKLIAEIEDVFGVPFESIELISKE